MKGHKMSYAITKGDITVEELEPRECEEYDCDQPATHGIQVFLRAKGEAFGVGMYCKLHAQFSWA